MKSKKILAVLLTLLTVLTVFSFSAYALNWDGSSAGGSTNAVNGSSTGYVIRSTNDSNCVVGYRFSVVNEAGNMKVNKVIDVFRNTGNGDNAYSTSAKFTTKYNKKQLIANKNATLTTSVNTTNCYKEKDMGFVSTLPNPSGVETWQAYETNINKVLTKLGVGTVSNMYYGDKVIIEPLFDVCLAGEYQALTVTEIAYCGRSVKGGSSDGGTSNGTSSTWGFISNYTNRIWPNKLFTPNGQGLWDGVSAIGSSSKATFDNILTKGYGAGIAYNETTNMLYTIAYNANGGSGSMSSHTTTSSATIKTNAFTKTGYTFSGWIVKRSDNKYYHSSTGWTTSTASAKVYSSGVSHNFSSASWRYSSGNSGTLLNGNRTFTFIAQWTPITYTVTYNANGGSGAPGNQTKTYGVNLTLSSTKPTRTGYTFNGWNTKSDGTGTNYASGGKYTANANVTLYAKWTPVTYTVTYNANGGTGAPSAQTKTYGVDLTLSSTKPTRTGYTFNGWNTNSSGSGTNYSSGGKYTANANVTLYAKWTPITYTVKYYLDGVEQTSLRQTCTYGTSYKYPSVPTKTGSTVSGWWSGSSSSSKGTQYTAGASFSNLTSTNGGTVNRYAYSTPNTYTVKYYLDGVEQTSLKQTCTYGTSYNYKSLPTKAGYTVSGWWSGNSSASKGTQYTAGGSFSNLTTTNGGTVNRYAYTDATSYTVKYYLDGTEQTSLRQTCTYGVSYKYPSLPTKTGYTITGWWSGSSSSSKGTQYTAGSSFSNLSTTNGGVVNRYAYSSPITYQVKFNGNGSTSGSMSNQSFTYDAAQNLTANAFKRAFTVTFNYNGNGTANTTTTANATFNGWAKSASGSKVYNDKQSVKNLSSTQGVVVNIYAKWTDASVILPTPTRTGYVFNGWYTSSSGGTKVGAGGDKYTPSANITLYAQWTPITYTVKYNGNGNTSGSTASSSHTYDVSKALTANGFTKTGYKFANWNTKADGTGTSYTDKQSVKNLTTINGAVINLYAQWTPITYTIKFDGNGNTSGSTASMTMTYDVAKALTANGFKRTDHTFVCWSLEKDGQGPCYADKQSVKNMTTVNGGVVTLYAQWEEDRKLSLEAITPNAAYREGTEVITSFNIINEGTKDCIQSDNVSVVFKVYKDSTLIKTVTKNNVIVPGNDKNLIYFKWTVPENIGSSTIYVSGEIVENGSSYSLVKNPYETCKYTISATPDTQYEIGAPSGFTVPSVPEEKTNIATWTEWTYENGAFNKTKYGIGITSEGAVITPDASANATKENGKWVMKSGYGFGISVPNGVRVLDGCTLPTTSAYTKAQYTTALFPEFSYLTTINKYRTLELSGDNWIFRDNDDYGKIHFTPLWYPDGNYTVSVVQSDMWTPAGMISRQVNTNTVTISGSAYDDWYI